MTFTPSSRGPRGHNEERGMTASTPPTPASGRRTGIVKDDKYLNHCIGEDHPECPERLQALYSMLEDPEMAGRFKEVTARSATKEELYLVHSSDYVMQLEATEGAAFTPLDSDTGTCALSHEAALLAAGGLCRAVALVCSGELRQCLCHDQASRSPCGKLMRQGILPVQQHRDRRKIRTEPARARTRSHCGLGSAPRKRYSALF